MAEIYEFKPRVENRIAELIAKAEPPFVELIRILADTGEPGGPTVPDAIFEGMIDGKDYSALCGQLIDAHTIMRVLHRRTKCRHA